MNILWHVYHHPLANEGHASPRAVYLGDVWADAASRAEQSAATRFQLAIPLHVVADVTWRYMSTLERSVVLGTFCAPTEALAVDGVRVSVCKVCGEVIVPPVRVQKEGAHIGQKRRGRPTRYHEECAPPRVREWRAARALARSA